ncbi:MAG: phasin family protein [Betaproteobacteria bacterium]|nr:phasin family protein [Rhodocyclales bacterium]
MFAQLKNFTAENPFNFEASLTLANTVFASAERLAALNLNTARSLLEHSVANITALQGAKDAQSFITLQSAQAQPTVELAVAYSRGFYEIATGTKAEIAKIVEAQLSDTKEKVSGLVNNALKNAPEGSDAAVAGVRKVINMVNSAYDSMNQAAKQATKMAEANVAAASDAALKATTNATTKAKKAA